MENKRIWNIKNDEPIRINKGKGEPLYDMYEIELELESGEKKTIKVFCEPDTIDVKTAKQGVINAFFTRAFNTGTLTSKLKRDDFIFLGRLEEKLEENEEKRIKPNRYYKVKVRNGIEMTAQKYFDDVALPVLIETFGKNQQVQNTQLSNNYAENLYVRLIELLQDGNLARRNSEFEDVLQKLSLHIAKLNNYKR